jgi:hypothetical protein
MQISTGGIHTQRPFRARETLLAGKRQALEEKLGKAFHIQRRGLG